MSSNKQPKTRRPNDIDLKANPGIGQSQGIDNLNDIFEDEEGENTVEGDVLNDTTPSGGINPRQRGRTNR